ncbi:DUF6309 family protein [Sinosporangium siamense]|uniref:Uncharacterized protein n=1 Tax=Sinosporangium siamense TaxID=1367973 RepID=A0A919RD31_9ACTN|nr:DUF6309 family protein [Sinosporangium siamense]GII91701.1 hypothetical protein Ssi02_19320 [Sinosporangium siamense]
MKIEAKVPFEVVLKRFHETHLQDLEHEANTNVEAEEHVRNSDAMLGTWSRVSLSRQDILGVILPWHTGEEGGEFELISKAGLTVADTIALLHAKSDSYPVTNPGCWTKLRWLAAAPFTPLFLSTKAVTGVDYEELTVTEGLIHLDGLHRMLAWELWGRLPEEETIEAYLSGIPTPSLAAGPSETGRVHQSGV